MLACFAWEVAICSSFDFGTYSTPILNGHTLLELACEKNRNRSNLCSVTPRWGSFSVFQQDVARHCSCCLHAARGHSSELTRKFQRRPFRLSSVWSPNVCLPALVICHSSDLLCGLCRFLFALLFSPNAGERARGVFSGSPR